MVEKLFCLEGMRTKKMNEGKGVTIANRESKYDQSSSQLYQKASTSSLIVRTDTCFPMAIMGVQLTERRSQS
jgi:hypothetical protein